MHIWLVKAKNNPSTDTSTATTQNSAYLDLAISREEHRAQPHFQLHQRLRAFRGSVTLRIIVNALENWSTDILLRAGRNRIFTNKPQVSLQGAQEFMHPLR